ncbi:MAG TPA: hypothetical protein VFR02_07205, partial [bacterium]|nr:hypothetical protein [bacterium]
MTSGAPNQGSGITGATASGPGGLQVYGSQLFLADTGNNRVLIFNTLPTASGAPADLALGQPNLNSGTSGSANLYNSPNDVFFDGVNFFVSDTGNNRVLVYAGVPTGYNPTPSAILGQQSLTANSPNQGGSVANNTLYFPRGLWSNGATLVVADSANNRVLFFTSPFSTNEQASLVLGQTGFSAAVSNQGNASPSSSTLNSPYGVWFDGTRLYVGDTFNNRVLAYNGMPVTNGATAALVLGQTGFSAQSPNQGGSTPNAGTFYYPNRIFSNGSSLFVADGGNDRVLVFNSAPVTSGTPAGNVLGQPNFTSNSSNEGGCTGSSTLDVPAGVYYDGSRLFVSDNYNNRTLVFVNATATPTPTPTLTLTPLPSCPGGNGSVGVGTSGFVTTGGTQSVSGQTAVLAVTFPGPTYVTDIRVPGLNTGQVFQVGIYADNGSGTAPTSLLAAASYTDTGSSSITVPFGSAVPVAGIKWLAFAPSVFVNVPSCSNLGAVFNGAMPAVASAPTTYLQGPNLSADYVCLATPTPTLTATPTLTSSVTVSPTVTLSETPTPTVTLTYTQTPTITLT